MPWRVNQYSWSPVQVPSQVGRQALRPGACGSRWRSAPYIPRCCDFDPPQSRRGDRCPYSRHGTPLAAQAGRRARGSHRPRGWFVRGRSVYLPRLPPELVRDRDSKPPYGRSNAPISDFRGHSSFTHPLTVDEPVLFIAFVDEQHTVESRTAIEHVSLAVVPRVEPVVSRTGNEAVPTSAVG